MSLKQSRPVWRLTIFVLLMLLIEFMDEFSYSALEAARPLIRDDFALNYIQVGLITTIPITVAIFIEPIMGLFADTSKRRLMMVAAGVLFGLGLIIQGFSTSFFIFMIGMTLEAPANGVFVNIAQAALMDDAPHRRENRMALWTVSGSLAVVVGPLMMTVFVALGLNWRLFFLITGIVAVIVALAVLRLPPNPALRSTENDETESRTVRQNLEGAWVLLRSAIVWRWLILLECSNLMLDVLFGLLALYMVDIVGVSQAQAGIAIAVWTGIGLIGDFLLIPLLEKVRGLSYLRVSAFAELILFPLFLLVDGWWMKLILLGIIGLFNAGWYAILQGKLYDTLGEQSGAVLIVGNAAGLFGAMLPVILGTIAQIYGLDIAMWFLLAGPIALLIGLPFKDEQ
mgnify:CR=1 FL=1